MSYWRFGAMIVTSVVVMFGIKYLSTYEWSHVWYSETRTYMALMMGGAMGVIMLGFMLGMYRSKRLNAAIFVGCAALFGVSLWLVRSQETVQDASSCRRRWWPQVHPAEPRLRRDLHRHRPRPDSPDRVRRPDRQGAGAGVRRGLPYLRRGVRAPRRHARALPDLRGGLPPVRGGLQRLPERSEVAARPPLL